MKTKIFLNSFLLGLFVICTTLFADLSGKWDGVFNMGATPFTINYAFTVQGDKLTGTVTSPQGVLPITDGKTDGTDFSFTVTATNATFKSAGRYYSSGDSIAINTDFNGRTIHTRLTRGK